MRRQRPRGGNNIKVTSSCRTRFQTDFLSPKSKTLTSTTNCTPFSCTHPSDMKEAGQGTEVEIERLEEDRVQILMIFKPELWFYEELKCWRRRESKATTPFSRPVGKGKHRKCILPAWVVEIFSGVIWSWLLERRRISFLSKSLILSTFWIKLTIFVSQQCQGCGNTMACVSLMPLLWVTHSWWAGAAEIATL